MKILEGIPNILYKYRDYTNDFNRRTLFDFELFLSSTSMFNDPYEGSIPFEYDQEDLTIENIFLKMRKMAMKKYSEWDEAQIHDYCFKNQRNEFLKDDAHIERVNQKNREDIDKIFGILSLTKQPLNYLMWSHYGNSHNGICLGFDATILYKVVGGTISPVVYNTEMPKMKLFGDINDFHLKQLSTKSDIWTYEEEYRIVKSFAAKQTISYPKEMLKEVYLGCKLPFQEKLKIIDFIKDKGIDCRIYELSLNKKVFKLDSSNIY
ncbi:MAG: DUF2971 domain-containing protein [Bacteroidetes bacterium]|nr:DUF2971 domain-containing protein [Bacteroidota bacterium]